MFHALSQHGVTGRAFQTGISQLICINPRDFAKGNYRRIDDRPYGGGPGMVMMAEPLAQSIGHARHLAQMAGCNQVPVVYMSPQGKTLDEAQVVDYLKFDGLIVLCGRYEGIDQRIIEHYVDFECSIGDYVLSGGELAAMVLMDSLVRRIPGVINDGQSAIEDSFVDHLLDCPHYTKPDSFEGMCVPAVLKSGDHAEIAKWRFLERYQRTRQRRPELLSDFKPNAQQQKWLQSLD